MVRNCWQRGKCNSNSISIDLAVLLEVVDLFTRLVAQKDKDGFH